MYPDTRQFRAEIWGHYGLCGTMSFTIDIFIEKTSLGGGLTSWFSLSLAAYSLPYQKIHLPGKYTFCGYLSWPLPGEL